MIITKISGIVLRNIHSTFLLINPKEKFDKSNKILARVNDSGKILWDILDTYQDLNSVIDVFCGFYNVPPEQRGDIAKDVFEYMQYLQMKGYVHCE